MIGELYRKLIPSNLRKALWDFRHYYFRNFTKEYRENREVKRSYGKLNPDKTFYVIGCDSESWGVFTACFYFSCFAAYAEEKGYIPVFDLKNNYMNLFQEEDKKGKENGWEYYFKQPYGYTLNDVYRSKNVILCKCNPKSITEWIDWQNISFFMPRQYDKYRRIFVKYFRFNDTLKGYVKEQRDKLGFLKKEKILGVEYRRSFERGHLLGLDLFKDHDRQPALSELIKVVRLYLQEWGYKYFFLSTDDSETVQICRKEFGDACIAMERPRAKLFVDGKPVPVEDVNIVLEEHNRGNDRYLSNIEYISEVILLSHCDAFLGTICSASQIAYILNGKKYEHILILDYGKI